MSEKPSAAHSPSPYAWYVLALLTLTYVFNFIDRQILAMLMEPIKQEFGVSDTAMGFLSGFAFVFFYTIAGIPVARWADRGSRKTIITLALAIWSAMTAACGLARNFVELAMLRVGVGIGEAGGSPPAHALIADYFPPRLRATALSLYACGVYVGAALAFLAGGWLIEHYDWRTAFYVVGLPGVLLALLVGFTLKEPLRGLVENRQHQAEEFVSFPEVVRYLLSRRAFVFVALGSAVQSLAGYGVLTWGPSFLGRVHHMPWTEIGIWLGWVVGVAGCIGAYAGGSLADRLARRDARWYMRLPALQSLLCVPFVAAFALLDDKALALLCFIPFYTFGAMYVGPMFSVIQGVAPLRMRTTASALLLFFVNMIGLGFGPLLVGVLNDYAFAAYGQEAIRYSLMLVGCLGGFASLLFWQASRDLREELAAAQAA